MPKVLVKKCIFVQSSEMHTVNCNISTAALSVSRLPTCALSTICLSLTLCKYFRLFMPLCISLYTVHIIEAAHPKLTLN